MCSIWKVSVLDKRIDKFIFEGYFSDLSIAKEVASLFKDIPDLTYGIHEIKAEDEYYFNKALEIIEYLPYNRY